MRRTSCRERVLTMPLATPRVTVIGAGLAGTEAAWQLAERGVAVTLVEMRPAVTDARPITQVTSRSSCAPTRSRTTTLRPLPACSSARWNCLGSIVLARREPPGSPPAPRSPSTATASRRCSPGPSRRTRSSTSPAARPWSCPTGPSSSRPARSRARRSKPALRGSGRRRTARLLRRGGSDRRRRDHGPDRGLRRLPLRQGGGCRLPQRPDDPRGVRALLRRARGRRARHAKDFERNDLFSGVPAGRGGRAHRDRRTAVRRAQAGRSHRSADRRAAVGGRAAACRERRADRVQPRRLPDEPHLRRAATRLPR